jgi:hypothetical protein
MPLKIHSILTHNLCEIVKYLITYKIANYIDQLLNLDYWNLRKHENMN